MGIVSKKLRDSARGQECTLQIPLVCNHDLNTTVLAHLPSEVKGMGTKSDDQFAVFACEKCHSAIDLHYNLPGGQRSWYMLRALQRTQKIQRDMGLIIIAGDNPKPRKPSRKILPYKPMVQS